MIGYEPIVDNMVIVTGQGLSHFFGLPEGDAFPYGTTVTLKVYARDNSQLAAWPAVTVEPGGALVQINADDLDAIPDSASFRVFVEYPGEEPLCWYRGRVWRR